jgi:hypothetical protein
MLAACATLFGCLVLSACNDTTDLAPASPDTPWQISTTLQNDVHLPCRVQLRGPGARTQPRLSRRTVTRLPN